MINLSFEIIAWINLFIKLFKIVKYLFLYYVYTIKYLLIFWISFFIFSVKTFS